MRTVLTTKEVAEALGVSKFTIYGYIHEGTLDAHKIGGSSKKRHWRIKVSDLEKFINNGGAEQNTLGRKLNANQEQVAVSAPPSPNLTKVKCRECGWVDIQGNCKFGHNDFYCPNCGKETIEVVE